MIKLEQQLKDFELAINRLKDVLAQPKNEFIRDSAIQRFEFCFDICWKSLKTYIETRHGIISKSPKETFREAYIQKLIEYDNYWITLTDLRNETSHSYNEEIAEKIYNQLPTVLEKFTELHKQLLK